MKQNRWNVFMVAGFLAFTAVSSWAGTFLGMAVEDNNFSTKENWNKNEVPTKNEIVLIGANHTSSENPAIVDAQFSATLGNVKIHSSQGFGKGMSVVEIVSGGMLRTSSLIVGNNANNLYDGRLIIRAGGFLKTSAANGGVFAIGGNAAGQIGIVEVEAGVSSFSHARLNLNEFGTLTFVFDKSSVSTLYTMRQTGGHANLLNGMVQVDLDALKTEGTYELITSFSATLQIEGALRTWLDEEGGSFSHSGSFEGSHFTVLNGKGKKWSLSLSDNQQSLVLAVTAVR